MLNNSNTFYGTSRKKKIFTSLGFDKITMCEPVHFVVCQYIAQIEQHQTL